MKYGKEYKNIEYIEVINTEPNMLVFLRLTETLDFYLIALKRTKCVVGEYNMMIYSVYARRYAHSSFALFCCGFSPVIVNLYNIQYACIILKT